MIAVDTSVALKWFKRGERYDAEAQDLYGRIARREVEAAASEIISLEVVRGLKNAQVRQPALGIQDEDIERFFAAFEALFRSGAVLECPVGEIKPLAKDAQLHLGLFTADAIHLATALHFQVSHFVVDDGHFLASPVTAYVSRFAVKVVRLPEIISDLNARAR